MMAADDIRRTRLTGWMAAAAVALWLAPIPAAGQALPRSSDGKPDLSGFWQALNTRHGTFCRMGRNRACRRASAWSRAMRSRDWRGAAARERSASRYPGYNPAALPRSTSSVRPMCWNDLRTSLATTRGVDCEDIDGPLLPRTGGAGAHHRERAAGGHHERRLVRGRHGQR